MAEDVWLQSANLVGYPSCANFVSGFIPKLQSMFILAVDMNMRKLNCEVLALVLN
jgi:hypothetical protein